MFVDKMRWKRIKRFTHLQYDSPFGFDTQTPSFLHGDGAHDVNPEMKQNEIQLN